VQYVKAGRLGRKSGRGVYEYPEAAVKPETNTAKPMLADSPAGIVR
jgi:3-hydroxyacyl-CoA dehydrogenase